MTTKILSIDGGGCRGLIPLCILYVLEKRTGKQIYQMFDVIAGTSTGAIIAALLSIGEPVENIISFYIGDKIKKIFSKDLFHSIGTHCPKYDSNNIENVLKDTFGDKTFGDCLIDLLIPTDDWSNRQGVIFSTFETKSIKLWQATRKSSAAETFFSASEGCFDGGLYASNPTDLAIVKTIKHTDAKLEDLFVVSLGTGTLVDKMSQKDIAKFWWDDFAKHLIPETMDRITSKTHDILSELLDNEKYFRFQFDCPTEFESMDNVSDKNLRGLKDLADSYISTIWIKDINKIITYLKQ